MSDQLNKIQLRSEEVQDILTRVPNWMIRFGSSLLLILVFLLLLISWVIKYPDIIAAEAVVTTQFPPQKEYARSTGKLDVIYVEDSQKIYKNTVLAVLKNSAKTDDVYYLKSILDTITINKKHINFPIKQVPILVLGDIETAYANFENSYITYQLNQKLRPFNNDKVANEISIIELRSRLQNLESQYVLNKSELKLKKSDFNRNETLLKKGVISQLDYETKQIELLNSERGLKNLATVISQTREAIASAHQSYNSTQITKTTEESRLVRNLIQSFNQLKKTILDWENNYVLKSEIDGKVSFLNYWSNNQSVVQGDVVFSIVPKIKGEYIAKLKAKPQNSGKIEIGQNVNIKLQNYPDTEFGLLKGKIVSISLTADNEGFYIVNVSLPRELITSYNKKIEFKQEMNGIAEIITEDLRLFERFFNQLKSLIKI